MEIESTEATGARDWASDRSQTNGARRGAESFRGCCQTTHWHSVRSPFLKRKSKSRLTTSSQLVVDRAIIWWKSVESCQFDSTGNSLLFFFVCLGHFEKKKPVYKFIIRRTWSWSCVFQQGEAWEAFSPVLGRGQRWDWIWPARANVAFIIRRPWWRRRSKIARFSRPRWQRFSFQSSIKLAEKCLFFLYI